MQDEPTTPNGFQSDRGVDLSPEAVFARRVKERREFLGMSQTELARNLSMMGLSLDGTAVTRLEKGERRVRLNEAVGVTLLLGLDLYDVIAPHPGDLAEQLDRADIAQANAEYAASFWAKELEAARKRTAELRAMFGEQQTMERVRRERWHEEAQRAIASGDPDALYGEGMWTVEEEGDGDGVDQEAP